MQRHALPLIYSLSAFLGIVVRLWGLFFICLEDHYYCKIPYSSAHLVQSLLQTKHMQWILMVLQRVLLSANYCVLTALSPQVLTFSCFISIKQRIMVFNGLLELLLSTTVKSLLSQEWAIWYFFWGDSKVKKYLIC